MSHRALCLIACFGGLKLAANACFCPSIVVADEHPDDVAKYGMAERPAWTTSRFVGRPEPPPPFRAEPVYPKLAFDRPTVLTSAPGTDRWFVAEHAGKIYSVPRDPASTRADLLIDVNDLVGALNRKAAVEDRVRLVAVYGMTFHPRFESNRYCYVCYVVRWQDTSRGQHPRGTRVVRLKVAKSNPPVCHPGSEQQVITWLQGGHNGGCLKFGADGYLYISTGDGGFAFPPDGRNAGQDVSNLLSSVLRIDVNHSQADRAYAIPSDNPFVSLEGARGEIWAYGMRNPWKMSFDRATGELWVGDVGWELWELVYRVRRGDNFGWSLVEGSQPVHAERRRGPTPIVPPAIEIPHTDGASVTGGFVYRGKNFPELVGTYIFGDWETRRIWGVNTDQAELGARIELVEPTVRIVGFAEDHHGEIFLLDYDNGSIQRMVHNKSAGEPSRFPVRLSETGIFDSVADHRVAVGVIPFSINAEQWSDHAVAQRWLAVPGEASIQLHAEPKPVEGSMFRRQLDFPKNTILLKTLSLDLIEDDPASRKRIESQILHFDGREWRGYSYAWNDDQTDAVLVDANGHTHTLDVVDPRAPGGRRKQPWRFPSRTECMRCHNPWAEHTLAFNIPQINRDHEYAMATDNQIRTLRHAGLIVDAPVDANAGTSDPESVQPLSPEALPRLADPHDPAAAVGDRGRSYLQVNCAHCHRDGGGGAAHLHLPFDTPLSGTKALGLRPTQGTFGIPDARILAAGDPYRSVLYYRMTKTGPGHMPHLGAKMIDDRGVELIHDWIRQLPVHLDDSAKVARLIQLDEPTVVADEQMRAAQSVRQLARQIAAEANRESPNGADVQAAKQRAAEQAATRAGQRQEERTRLIGELLASPPPAMLLARAIRNGRLPETVQRLAIELALRREDLAIRDLFEAFVPDDQRTQRLGDSIRPDEILTIAGDARRGYDLFHKSANVQCRSCHQIDGMGVGVGPDLSEIGKKLNRRKLLESILEPSKNVDPKFTMWLVETTSGKVVTGLLVSKDEKRIILKDTRNKQHVFANAEIEGVFPQRKSLMPELLLRDFTARQVADLLSYLETRRGGD